MRAVWMTRFGGPEVLVMGEAPDPVPGEGEVLIDVVYANITFVETQFRSGRPGPFQGTPPLIPGNGVGGVIGALGPGVDPGLLGRRVVSGLRGSGGYAEKVVVDATAPIEVPEGLALDDAVAVLADGRTATMLIHAAAPRPGERVLVEAAAGGVGTLLVQLARARGATVVGLAGGEHKLSLVRELGADLAVDYRTPGWDKRVAEVVEAVDVVFDGVGGDAGRTAFRLLAEGGRMLSFGLASGEWAGIEESVAAGRGVTLVQPRPTPADLRGYAESALAEAAAGRLRPVIGRRFPLGQAAAAHTAIESRTTRGKTLLEVAA